MAFSTVQDYVDEARVLLLDEIAPFRYQDSDMVKALNMAFFETRRLRPDLFLSTNPTGSVPSFTAVDNTPVVIDPQYVTPLVYFLCGSMQMRDEESTQDSRAGAFMAMFKQAMTGAV